jgi:DNA helicase-2/ATP-dependent DNA helicase PcrA
MLPIRPGEKVKHPAFGNGVVVSVRPSGDDHEVAVAFPAGGVKRLLLSLAKLERDQR